MKALDKSGLRIEIDPEDTLSHLRQIALSSRVELIQFSKPLSSKAFEVLNDEVFAARPELQLRAYGFYGGVCDLRFCTKLSNVRHFKADCLQNAEGLENIPAMRRLESLGVGVWNLENFDFMQEVNPSLRELVLSESRTKKPDLSFLERFQDMAKLFINGHRKGLETVSTLRKLRILSLSSITVDSLGFLRGLERLWSLTILLGGTRNLSQLRELPQLKHLELSWIRQLEDLRVISDLVNLEHLSIDRLMHVHALPNLGRLSHLRRVTLDVMKGLTDVSALIDAPALEEVIHIDAKVQPEDYLPLLQKPSVKRAQMGFGGTARNKRFQALCGRNGVTTGYLDPFRFSAEADA